jgi:hypothetical protein
MGRGKNTIKLSDISTAPILTKYSASYTSQSIFDERYGITSNRGTNEEILTRGTPSERALKYRVIRQLYYQNFLTGSVNSLTASYWDSNLQSTAASGTFDDDYRYFPSESGANIGFLAIPTLQFGEQIKRSTFLINSNTGLFSLRDDGNGNILDVLNSNVHVGNILYAQGIATITNEDYFCTVLDNTFAVSVSIVPTPIPSATPSITPSITRTPSTTPTPTLSVTPSLSFGATPSVSLTPSVTSTPSVTPVVTPSVSLTPSVTSTPSVSITPSVSLTPSVTRTPSVTPSTTAPQTILSVYARDVATTPGPITIYADINGGGPNDIFTGTLNGTCTSIYTFTAGILSPGDSVVFTSNINCLMNGSDTTSCPASGGGSTTYTINSISLGANAVALTVNTEDIP